MSGEFHPENWDLMQGEKTVTKKKRKPVSSIEKLSDDLKGQRALKGSKQLLAVTTSSLDRWISKAIQLEERLEIALSEPVTSKPHSGDKDLAPLMNEGKAP